MTPEERAWETIETYRLVSYAMKTENVNSWFTSSNKNADGKKPIEVVATGTKEEITKLQGSLWSNVNGDYS